MYSLGTRCSSNARGAHEPDRVVHRVGAEVGCHDRQGQVRADERDGQEAGQRHDHDRAVRGRLEHKVAELPVLRHVHVVAGQQRVRLVLHLLGRVHESQRLHRHLEGLRRQLALVERSGEAVGGEAQGAAGAPDLRGLRVRALEQVTGVGHGVQHDAGAVVHLSLSWKAAEGADGQESEQPDRHQLHGRRVHGCAAHEGCSKAQYDEEDR